MSVADMINMIERVAKAIDAAGSAWIDSNPLTGWADVPSEVFARAAIEAMREPTKEMIARGCETEVSHSWSSRGELICDPETVWQAMIDVALRVSDEHAVREDREAG